MTDEPDDAEERCGLCIRTLAGPRCGAVYRYVLGANRPEGTMEDLHGIGPWAETAAEFSCTREPGHKGWHRACGGELPCCLVEWTDEERCRSCGGPSTRGQHLVCDDCGRLWVAAPARGVFFEELAAITEPRATRH